jgi:hypothetical protein
MSYEQMAFLFNAMGIEGIRAMGLEPAWNQANTLKVARRTMPFDALPS